MLLPSGDIYVSDQINFNLYDGSDKIIRGGYVIFEGHGRESTCIINNSTNHRDHAFMLGDTEEHRGTSGTADLGVLTLRDLSLEGETNAETGGETFAVLRMWQGRSRNVLQNVTVRQNGVGHGIDGTDVFLSSFYEVRVRKHEDVAGYTGRGVWLHTEEHPFHVSGEFELQRISAFGPWNQGIVLGENTGDRFFGGLTAQFLNAEHCREGIVIGKGAADVDVSVIWVERNQVCGVRIYNGAKDVTIRRIYSWHTPSDPQSNPVDPNYPDPPIPNKFRGDVILGKATLDLGNNWNVYEGIEIDGVFQHYIYGPAVRLCAMPNEVRRDIMVKNIRAGNIFEYVPFGSEEIQHLVSPYTDAVVKIAPGDYEGLFVERVRPWEDAKLSHVFPGGGQDPIVALIDNPDLADRVVYSGPYNEQFSFGVHEERNQVNALRTRYHTASATLGMKDPTYHRVDTSSGAATITLPDINGFGFVPDRLGAEFHLMRIAGSAAQTVTV